MSSISLDLDFVGMYNLSKEDIVKRLEVLKQYNVTTFAVPYEILLNKELTSYKERLFEALSQVGFELVLNACTIRTYSSEYVDDKHLEDSIAFHTQYIFNTYESLKEYNLHNNLKIIFKGGRCLENNISLILDKTITFFREISLAAQKINVDILLEVSESNFALGRVVGDNWQDISVICGAIQNTNFGILWNMKNTRHNNLKNSDLLIPPSEVLDRIIMPAITNTTAYEHNVASYNVEMQFEEIKALIKNGYKGAYHLEFTYSEIYEKGVSYDSVYESIEYLNYLLTYYNNENNKNELVINYDPERMNRRYIRRTFTKNTLAILETNNYKSTYFEMSEKFIRITTTLDLKLEIGTEHKIIIKVNNKTVELNTMLAAVRNNYDKYDYVFMINNLDRITKKSICEIVYLTN